LKKQCEALLAVSHIYEESTAIMLKSILKGSAVALALGVAVSAQAEEGISIANGKVKMNGLFQTWLVNDTSLNQQVNSTGVSNGAKTDFRVRRAELTFNGALSDSTRWLLDVDFARPFGSNSSTALNVLNDLVISQTVFMPELTIDAGQFKQPLVSEGLDPTGQLLFPERSMVARTWGELRSAGARIAYTAPMWKLQGSVFNGNNFPKGNNINNNGQNLYDVDQNNGNTDAHPNNKDLAVRFDIKPMDMVSAGAFTYFPSFNWGQGGAFGANLRLMPMEDLIVRGEYVRGWVRSGTDNLPRNGYAFDAGYQYGDFQPVVRYEIQQQGTTAANTVTAAATTIGLNYYMMKHNSKLQFAYSLLGHNTSGSNAAAGVIGTSGYGSATGGYAPQAGTGGTLAVLAWQLAI